MTTPGHDFLKALPSILAGALLSLAVTASGFAFAHELYLVELWATPDPPPAGASFVLNVDLRDRRQSPVVDHRLEARYVDDGAPAGSFPILETDEPGFYRGTLPTPHGAADLELFDLTHDETVPIARLEVRPGGDATGTTSAVVGGGPDASGTMRVWLILLLGAGVAAGAGVTLWVLRAAGPKPPD